MPENLASLGLWMKMRATMFAFESIYYLLQRWYKASRETHMMTYILWLDIFIIFL
jgi:hypothetical protein